MAHQSFNGPSSHVTQNWEVKKPTAEGRGGVVVTQAGAASTAGVEILEAGGTAADAAVAAALTLAVIEPWNSGLGGIGYGVVRDAEGHMRSLNFGAVAPHGATVADYPLTGEESGEIFGWPKVEEDRNVHGPFSFCVPSAVAGLGTLHDTYGRLSWQRVVEPALNHARVGMAKDWFSTVKISQMGHILQKYPDTARIYLPNNLPPVAGEKGNPLHLKQGNLEHSLELLANEGWRSFYEGDLAERILRDFATVGSPIDRSDLLATEAVWEDIAPVSWGGHKIYLPSDETAAGVLRQVLDVLEPPKTRDASWFKDLSAALMSGARGRIDGTQTTERESCTTHLNVVDSQGMTISFTTTLLGLMGSGVVLPETGVLMNNGMMWFDPRQGRPNSIRPNVRPQSNMLPMIAETRDQRVVALGASGGRRIISAVINCLADVAELRMSPHESAHSPRIDVSSSNEIIVDRRMSESVIEALSKVGKVTVSEHAAAPLNFGCPSVLEISEGVAIGQPDVMTPWSAASAVQESPG